MRIVWLLKLTGRYVTDGLQQLSVIKPVDPFEGGKVYVLDMTPRPLPSNHLGIKQSDDRFGQGAVVRGTDTGHPDPGSRIRDRDSSLSAAPLSTCSRCQWWTNARPTNRLDVAMIGATAPAQYVHVRQRLPHSSILLTKLLWITVIKSI